MTSSPIDRLQATNPYAEIWWDSSPLVFQAWRDEMIAAAPEARKEELRAQLDRLNDFGDGKPGAFRGCTTNPPLSLAAVKQAPDLWNPRIDALAAEHPGLDAKALAWLLYKEVIQRGAEAFHPLWEASEGRYGYVSGQLDPRLFTETDEMVTQAREIRALAPNVMVKVPASTQGVDVLRAVTAEGIPTNVTTCFTVPQVMAVAKAAVEGLALAAKNGVDTKKWRAVITLMLARLTERPVLDEQARAYGVDLTPIDKKWFGLAVFKRSYRLLAEGGFPSKLLLCSVRPGPVVAGRTAFWDVEEVAGGNIVYTLPAVRPDPHVPHGRRPGLPRRCHPSGGPGGVDGPDPGAPLRPAVVRAERAVGGPVRLAPGHPLHGGRVLEVDLGPRGLRGGPIGGNRPPHDGGGHPGPGRGGLRRAVRGAGLQRVRRLQPARGPARRRGGCGPR